MMSESDFLSQNGETLSAEGRKHWFQRTVREHEDKGAKFHRLSVHPDLAHLILVESWKVEPQDYGEIRWQLVAVSP